MSSSSSSRLPADRPSRHLRNLNPTLTTRQRMMATLMGNAKAPCCTSFEAFRLEMMKLFDRSARGDSWQCGLSQGITDFAICFRTLAASCEWNEPALRARFMEGLNATIADELALDLPQKLEDLINLSFQVEGHLAQRHQRTLLTVRGTPH